MRFRMGRLEAMTTFLVVDDEPMVRDVVARYLERDGHRVVTAQDGESARGLIEQEEPSLVLLDVMLPGRTDGLELCRWIRSTSDLPVILLTARVEETDRIVGLELGADDYVTKPFSPRALAARAQRTAPAGASLCRPARDRCGEARGATRRRAPLPDGEGVRPALVPRLEP